MRAWIHEEGRNGLVLELVAENVNDGEQLSLFVQQPGRLFFQAQTWNDPLAYLGCSWVSIAVTEHRSQMSAFERARQAYREWREKKAVPKS